MNKLASECTVAIQNFPTKCYEIINDFHFATFFYIDKKNLHKFHQFKRTSERNWCGKKDKNEKSLPSILALLRHQLTEIEITQ